MQDLNPLPTAYKAVALPDELNRQDWPKRMGSNHRHADLEAAALPTELLKDKNGGDWPKAGVVIRLRRAQACVTEYDASP